MAVNYKDITQLEELETLPDDAEILVVTDGKAKKISKGNAKFGGGSTVYTIDDGSGVSTAASDDEATIYPLYNMDGTQPTAQEVYDAFMGGQVIVKVENKVFMKTDFIEATGDSEDDVVYVEVYNNSMSSIFTFSAGENPSN